MAAAVDVTQVLLNAQSPDGAVRNAAEANLKRLEEQEPGLYQLSMAAELAAEGKPAESRRLAGLNLKNSLDARDTARKHELTRRWIAHDENLKSQIKAAVILALSSPLPEAGHTAAQALAKLAAIELPLKQWPDLIARLLDNMSESGTAATHQRHRVTLEALGYICEEVPHSVLAKEQVDSVLTAVVQGMTDSTSDSPEVRLAATNALCNALGFAQSNFEHDRERNCIMTVVCQATQSTDCRVRQAAFECLVAIASTYYHKLQPYMQDIFAITSRAVREDVESVALQGIEFWSAICDEEMELEAEMASEPSGSFAFIKKALPYLVPLLLEAMGKQDEEEEPDEDAWNIAMAAGTCLGLVARTVEDDIVPLVMPFVSANICKPDWRSREAATYAFGSILEGPRLEQLAPLVKGALGFMLNAMKDQNSQVKDTTAWTLGRIFEILHGGESEVGVVTPEALPSILSVLLEALKDSPVVADRTCGALYFLAAGYEPAAAGPTSPLSPFFPAMVQALLAASEREDAADGTRLRASVYETLNQVVRSSSLDSTVTVVQLVPVVMQKLNNTLAMQPDGNTGRLQALLCGVLQVLVQKLSVSEEAKAGLRPYTDQLMELFLKVFASRSATVHEEAMLAIGALAYAVGSDFEKYMPQLLRYLEMGLSNFEEYQVCAVTVGVVGDVCRALESKVLPFCDAIMTHLLKDLSSTQLHRSVKPPIFSLFGDVALAIGGNFDKYLPFALPMLQGAAEITAQQQVLQQQLHDEEVIEHNNELRTGILEAYSGILQGLRGANKADLMAQAAFHLLQFIESIHNDKDSDLVVTKAAVGVLGDLAIALGSHATALFRQAAFYRPFLEDAQQSDDQQLMETSSWAMSAITRIVS